MTTTLEKEIPFTFELLVEKCYLEKEAEKEEGEWIVEGIATTTTVDYEDEMVTLEAMESAISSLRQNTTVLFNHDRDKPIGKILDVVLNKKTKALLVKILISKSVPDIWQMIREGVINSLSIKGRVLKASQSWDELARKYITKIHEMHLFETSLVSIPANPEAKTVSWYIKKSMEENLPNIKEVKKMEVTQEKAQGAEMTPEEFYKSLEIEETVFCMECNGEIKKDETGMYWCATCEKQYFPYGGFVYFGIEGLEKIYSYFPHYMGKCPAERKVNARRYPYPYPYPYKKPAKKEVEDPTSIMLNKFTEAVNTMKDVIVKLAETKPATITPEMKEESKQEVPRTEDMSKQIRDIVKFAVKEEVDSLRKITPQRKSVINVEKSAETKEKETKKEVGFEESVSLLVRDMDRAGYFDVFKH